MRVLTPVTSSVIEYTTDANTQVVPVGELAVLRAFAAVPSGVATQDGSATVTFRSGTVSGDLMLTYEVPYNGIYVAGGNSLVLRSPLLVVPIPGIGIRFSDGMNVKFDVTGTLGTSVQVFYT